MKKLMMIRGFTKGAEEDLVQGRTNWNFFGARKTCGIWGNRAEAAGRRSHCKTKKVLCQGKKKEELDGIWGNKAEAAQKVTS
jgi:hypothetical protein